MTHLVLQTTKAELKARWKQLYRDRKQCQEMQLAGWYSYYSGMMNELAWLILYTKEVSE
jgi:hypothetical protein